MDFTKVEKETFDNGFRVMMLNDESSRSVSVSLWIGSGTRLERPEDAGVSHFIEHMLFKGTQKRTAMDIAEETDYIGGNFNAYTSKEHTCIYARALSSHLGLVLDIMGDMVTHSRLAPEDIEVERGVILEEIGMYEDSPEDVMVDSLYSAVWSGDMLGANILGTRETVGRMTAEQLRGHMERQYSPHRMVLAVSGAFDREALLAQARELFGGMKNSGEPYVMLPAETRHSTVLVERDFEQLQLCLGFTGVSIYDDDRFNLGVLNNICGGSSSSRLFQRIREQLGLAYSIDSATISYAREGLVTVYGGVSPKNDLEALAEITRVLCRLRKDGVTEKELDRAREQIKAGLIMGLEGSAAASSHMGRSELYGRTMMTEDELIERYNAITVDDVNNAARRFIDFDNFSLCAVGKVRDEQEYIRVVHDAVF